MNKKELLFLSIGIFLTVIAWLIADIYHAATQEKIREKIQLPNLRKYEIKSSIFKILQEKKP
ncbi:MAG: hypothetical protein ACK4FL_01400 [Microgenomates group bacterium]